MDYHKVMEKMKSEGERFKENPQFLRHHTTDIVLKNMKKFLESEEDGKSKAVHERYSEAIKSAVEEENELFETFVAQLENPATKEKALSDLKQFLTSNIYDQMNSFADMARRNPEMEKFIKGRE